MILKALSLLNDWEYRDFAVLQSARVLMFISNSMMSVAVGWHVYDMTGSALNLGLVGLAIFIPKLIFSFIGGDLADRFNRLRILNLAVVALFAGITTLWWFSKYAQIEVSTILLFVAVNSSVNALGSPAGTSLLPHLVSPQKLSRAIAWGSSVWQGSAIAGPALGGLIYGIYGGAFGVYGWCAVLEGTAAVIALLIRKPNYSFEIQGTMWSRVREGARFVFKERVILGAISLDLFAVLLGGAVALMPIYARDILQLGPSGLGLLRSSPAVGAAVMAAYLGFRPLVRRAGLKMFHAVLWFGIATIIFALSKTFWLSALALVILGAADMISVVIRHTLVQTRTPANMRGRVSAVNQVFIGASNELGEFESGLTAHWFGVVPAVLMGGIGTIAVVIYWRKAFPELFETDRL